jgi:hypothetical protein
MVAATGYIEIKDGQRRAVPILHRARMLALIGAAIVVDRLLITRPMNMVAAYDRAALAMNRDSWRLAQAQRAATSPILAACQHGGDGGSDTR